ncbi:MAG: ATP-binding cassette domain-containing protein [Candidatus Nanopelagicales bacterium]|nr:ATP-binding cassette domain-containing protein [Candidatus Nanopelagicales bacterium]
MTVTVTRLRKRYGSTVAVDDLSFKLEPGVVTGFLGPNGSGKSTTMRLMLELDHGEGRTLWDGKRIREYPHVSRVVGAHLDARFFNPNRTARAHLRMMAADAGVSDRRVDEVIGMVGLQSVAKKRPKGFSMGMAQRLGLAGALLAEPRVLLLDEPANGLDPQSIQWLRDLLRYYASTGKIVFVSSHLLSEMQVMAERLVVITRGSLLAEEDLTTFVGRSTRNDVLVRSADRDGLARALRAAGLSPVEEGADGLAITGCETEQIGDVAFRSGIGLRELTKRTASLEEAFLELTSGAQDYVTQSAPGSGASRAGAPGPGASGPEAGGAR